MTVFWQTATKAMHQVLLNMRGGHQICPPDDRTDAIAIIDRSDQCIGKDGIATPDDYIANILVQQGRLPALYLVIELAFIIDPESQGLIVLDDRICWLVLSAEPRVDRLAKQLFSRAATVI